jgi:hypothetical protein
MTFVDSRERASETDNLGLIATLTRSGSSGNAHLVAHLAISRRAHPESARWEIGMGKAAIVRPSEELAAGVELGTDGDHDRAMIPPATHQSIACHDAQLPNYALFGYHPLQPGRQRLRRGAAPQVRSCNSAPAFHSGR